MSAGGGRRAAAVAALAAWTATLVVTVVGLHAVGGALAPPPLTSPGGWGEWLAARQPAEAAVAVVRLVVLALAWYLLAVTVAGTVARAVGAARLVRTTDALSVPLVRRLVCGVAGLSLATSAFTGTGAAAWAHGRSPQASPAAETMRRLPDDDAVTGGPPPTMRRLADDPGAQAPASTTSTTAAPSTTSTAAAPAAAAAEAGPARAGPAGAPVPTAAAAERTWTVRPGQHFWAVAEAVLAEAWGRQPTDAEVDAYWRALVAANRPVLRDPGNPDLVFPGQVVAVPAPPAAP